MSNPEVYVNHFEGYTTTFYVWPHRRECVIRWDNISPIEVVIPYLENLTPELFVAAIDKLLERAEDVVYEEYPFRSILKSSTESNSTYVIYWEPEQRVGVYYDNDIGDPDFLPKVRIQTSGHSDSIVHRTIAIHAMMHHFETTEDNLINIRRTLRY